MLQGRTPFLRVELWRCGFGLMYIRSEEPPLPRKPLEDVCSSIREGNRGPCDQFLDGVGHEDLAGLGCMSDSDAGEYRNAADGPVIRLNLNGLYANLHRDSKSLHDVSDRAPAVDGGGRPVEHGEDLVPDRIYLLPAVTGKLLADECGVLREQLEPATVAQRDKPFHRAGDVNEEHRR